MKKNVLLIVQNNSFPFDRRVYKEALSLKNNGYNVFVICPKSEAENKPKEVIDGIKVLRYNDLPATGGKLSYIFEYLNAITKIFIKSLNLIFSQNINIVHVANPPDFFWPLAKFVRLFGVKFIYDQHDLAPEVAKIKFQSNFFHKLLLLNEKLTVKNADGIIVVNNSFKKRLIERYNIDENLCEIVYNGPPEHFESKPNEQLIEKYKNHKVVLYIGLMAASDNINVIIEAAKKIVFIHGRKDIKFLLVGDGYARNSLEELTNEENLNDYVEFLGLVDYESVKEFLYIADVCVAPDTPNGLNEYLTLVKILEYLKAGKTFVSFDLHETRVIAGEAGLYAKNIDDYAEKILYLLDNPEKAKEMGAIGKERINRNFLWKHSEERLINLYSKLLEQK